MCVCGSRGEPEVGSNQLSTQTRLRSSSPSRPRLARCPRRWTGHDQLVALGTRLSSQCHRLTPGLAEPWDDSKVSPPDDRTPRHTSPGPREPAKVCHARSASMSRQSTLTPTAPTTLGRADRAQRYVFVTASSRRAPLNASTTTWDSGCIAALVRDRLLLPAVPRRDCRPGCGT